MQLAGFQDSPESHRSIQEIGPQDKMLVQPPAFRPQIVWLNVFVFLISHLGGIYGLFEALRRGCYCAIVWGFLVGMSGGLGITMGAHRMYAHKAYKAKTWLKVVLVFLHTVAGQDSMYVWVRDHRLHHKYSETDADPHDSRRGFFFSHVGWLMTRKHPEVIAKGKLIDMSDLEADPIVMFQRKYYAPLYFLVSMILPMLVPWWLWGEDLFICFFTVWLARSVVTHNITFLVNSAAHKFGNRPYTRDMVPVECEMLSFIAFGEGWHNYHHTFPWDYRASELGRKYSLSTTLLNLFAKWGWIYDLRTASEDMVRNHVVTKGDGSHPLWSPKKERTQ